MASTTTSGQWADLPADLLRDISCRLHAASDAVCFDAVCRPWRNALEYRKVLLPRLVAPSNNDDSAEDQRCRCTSYHAPGICVLDRRVARTDGTAAWLLWAHKELSLVNPLTADSLPFPSERLEPKWKWLQHRQRIILDDGTVLIYDFTPSQPEEYYPTPTFRASFLPHDEDGGRWRRVSSYLSPDSCCAAAYYYGYIVCVGLANCHILWPGWVSDSVPEGLYRPETTNEKRVALPDEPGKERRCSYLVESGGGLLLASVLQEDSGTDLSVSLHELCLRSGRWRNRVVEWVSSEQSAYWAGLLKLDDAVLFLGFPCSFAVDAAWFNGEVSGGTAYFVIDNTLEQNRRFGPPEPCSVYRYSFKDSAATLVETLPPGWHDAKCMWFLPDPKISFFSAPMNRGQGGNPATCKDIITQTHSIPKKNNINTVVYIFALQHTRERYAKTNAFIAIGHGCKAQGRWLTIYLNKE
ncbi:hypothetical protein VPH35_140179 [Triticum aestivum]